jgi:hypothetical protein
MEAVREVPTEQYEDILRRWDTWTGDADSPIFFTATDAGRKAYRDRISNP